MDTFELEGDNSEIKDVGFEELKLHHGLCVQSISPNGAVV
jgi:hypothetical protein